MNEQSKPISLSKPLSIKTQRISRIFFPFVMMVGVAFIVSVMNEVWLVAIFSFILGIFNTWLLIYYSCKIIISQEGVEAVYIFGKYQILWPEVEEAFYAWGNIFLEGNEKVMCFPAWEHWSQFDQWEAKNLLEDLSGQEIIVSYKLSRYFPSWKETRVRNQ